MLTCAAAVGTWHLLVKEKFENCKQPSEKEKAALTRICGVHLSTYVSLCRWQVSPRRVPVLCLLEPGTLAGADGVGFWLGNNHQTEGNDSSNLFFVGLPTLSSEDEVAGSWQFDIARVREGRGCCKGCHCMGGIADLILMFRGGCNQRCFRQRPSGTAHLRPSDHQRVLRKEERKLHICLGREKDLLLMLIAYESTN